MSRESKRQKQLRKQQRRRRQQQPQPPRSASYEHRGRVLQQLGFESYSSYLSSPLWATIRQRALEAERHLCRICQRPATQVHHQRYDHATMAGQVLRHLIPLCAGCHVSSELDRRGEKRKMPEVVERVDARINAGIKGRRKGRKVLKALGEDAEGMKAAGQAIRDFLSQTDRPTKGA
jgi:5-methylcytosine-specific restriction endonuclease McrA